MEVREGLACGYSQDRQTTCDSSSRHSGRGLRTTVQTSSFIPPVSPSARASPEFDLFSPGDVDRSVTPVPAGVRRASPDPVTGLSPAFYDDVDPDSPAAVARPSSPLLSDPASPAGILAVTPAAAVPKSCLPEPFLAPGPRPLTRGSPLSVSPASEAMAVDPPAAVPPNPAPPLSSFRSLFGGRANPGPRRAGDDFLRAAPPERPQRGPLPMYVPPPSSHVPTVEDVVFMYQNAVAAAGEVIDDASEHVRAIDAEIDYHRREIYSLRRARQEWVDSGARGTREREDARDLLSFRTAATPLRDLLASANSSRPTVIPPPIAPSSGRSSRRRAPDLDDTARAGPSKRRRV